MDLIFRLQRMKHQAPGPIVRFHRRKAGLSRRELAHLSGVSETAIYDIEKGKQTIRMRTLLDLLNVLNVRMEFTGPVMEEFVRDGNH